MSKVINISEVYEENRSNRMSKKMIIAILKNTISSLEDYDNVPWIGIEAHLKSSSVPGQSGKGTKYLNELERMKDNYYNPPLPLFIQIWESDGLVCIYPIKEGDDGK
jgi:hypothetical protein